jgi:hypothetical protein
MLWEADVPRQQVFRATVFLSLTNGLGDSHRVCCAAAAFGKLEAPASVLLLQPGATATIRAKGQWSVYGMDLRSYASQSNGAVQILGTYELERGVERLIAAASPPRSVTLVDRD